MARIRSIKPEFWGDEKLAPMCAIDRLVFLGLLSMADDAGRVVDSLRTVDGFIFPENSDSSRDSLARLADIGRILRYESTSGQALIQVVNWKRHQKIDHPSKYVLPAPPRTVARDAREGLARSSRFDLGSVPVPVPVPTTNDLKADSGERERRDAQPTPPSASAPHVASPNFSTLPREAISFGLRFYPGADVDAKRRRDVATQLVQLLGSGVRYNGGTLRATDSRLAAKCREVMREGVRDPDKAIVVLFAKLADSTEVTDAERQRDHVEREREQRTLTHELIAAESWLSVSPSVSSEIDEALEAQGFPATQLEPDPFAEISRRMARTTLVVEAWRTHGAPTLEEVHSHV